MAKFPFLIAVLATALSAGGSLGSVEEIVADGASTCWRADAASFPKGVEELRFVYSPDARDPALVLVTVREAGQSPMLRQLAVREVVDPEPEDGSFEAGVHSKDFTLEDGFVRLHVADTADRFDIRPEEGQGAFEGVGGSFVRCGAGGG